MNNKIDYCGKKLDRHNLVALRKAKLAATRLGQTWGNDDWYAMIGPIMSGTNGTCYILTFYTKKTDEYLGDTFIMSDCI